MFIPPTALLRLIPLTASTSLLIANFGQTSALRSWISPAIPPSVTPGKALPHWYNPWISRVLYFITPLYFVSLGGTASNIYTLPVGSARHWLMAEFVFTLLHLVPATKAYANIKLIRDRKANGRTNLSAVEAWLRVNRVRFWLTDVPAFVCAVVATGLIVQV